MGERALRGDYGDERLKGSEVKAGSRPLGEEWEKELQQELQDYELVGGENDVNDIGDDELEKEILQQLEEEAGSLS
nr:synapse-associated protein 1-like isoform X4 [Biomphalaria glabrata]